MQTTSSENAGLTSAVVQSLGLSADAIHQRVLQIFRLKKCGGSILDFGSGRGLLLKSLYDSGFKNIAGTDMMPRPSTLPHDAQWFQGELNQSLKIPDSSFDTVLAVEVIEHLENPRQVAREWWRLLRPSGTLILSTPNCHSYRSLMALIFKGHFVSFLERDYPAHITALTKLDLQRVLNECGFRDIEFHYTNQGLIPGFHGMSWQKISSSLFRGEKFSDNVIVVARK